MSSKSSFVVHVVAYFQERKESSARVSQQTALKKTSKPVFLFYLGVKLGRLKLFELLFVLICFLVSRRFFFHTYLVTMLVKHGKTEVPNSFLTHCCIQFSQQAVVKRNDYIAYVVALSFQNMKRHNAAI